jgi:hypothetical protein
MEKVDNGDILKLIQNDPRLKDAWDQMVEDVISEMEDAVVEVIRLKTLPRWIMPSGSGVSNGDLGG